MSELSELPVIEPKNLFLAKLILNHQRIYELIYVLDHPLKAINPMIGIIDSLDSASQNNLAEERKQLDMIHGNPDIATRKQILEIYKNLTKYLYQTYLSEVTKGIIPTASLKATEKKPRAKKHETILPSDV